MPPENDTPDQPNDPARWERDASRALGEAFSGQDLHGFEGTGGSEAHGFEAANGSAVSVGGS